jgi:hypothetical protein
MGGRRLSRAYCIVGSNPNDTTPSANTVYDQERSSGCQKYRKHPSAATSARKVAAVVWPES